MTSRKVVRWDGPNKRRARSRKLTLINQAQNSGYLSSNPAALTFAGAEAHFERHLIRNGVTSPENIITIQSSQKVGGYEGGPILHKLISKRDRYLPGMLIWPHTFKSFTEGYGVAPSTTYIPGFVGSPPAWYRSPAFRQEMNNFLEHTPRRFEIIDADICGVFSKENAECVSALMANCLAKRGLLFINHLKGRDGRAGKLLDFVREYFHACPYYDLESLVDDYGDPIDFQVTDALTLHCARYILAPIYYTCEAFNNGYLLEVERLVEYRDKNKVTNAGNNMLQWYFRFKYLNSAKLLDENKSMEEFATALEADRMLLRDNIELLHKERFPRTTTLD